MLLISGEALAHRAKPDTSLCLELEGRVENAHEGDSDCKVELIVDDKVVDSLVLTGFKTKFRFNLKRNCHYTLRLSKPGYVSRDICVHTRISAQYRDTYKFIFETKLLPVREKTAPHAVDNGFPVAKIYFHEKKGCFYYSKNYNMAHKRDLCNSGS